MKTQQKKAFTITELIVTLAILSTLMAMLFPALAAARNMQRRVSSAYAQSEIYLAFTAYAKSNNHYYPGVAGSSKIHQNHYSNESGSQYYGLEAGSDTHSLPAQLNSGTNVGVRYHIAIKAMYLNPKKLISPQENVGRYNNASLERTLYNPENTDPEVYCNHYSYAMQSLGYTHPYPDWEYGKYEPEKNTWTIDQGANIIFCSDRNIDESDNPVSIWKKEQLSWAGNVTRGDGSTLWQNSAFVENTKYGVDMDMPTDALFTPENQGFQVLMPNINSYGTLESVPVFGNANMIMRSEWYSSGGQLRGSDGRDYR